MKEPTREQLLDASERDTLARVRDLLRRGGAAGFFDLPQWEPPKEPSEDAETGDAAELAAWKAYTSELQHFAETIHTALEQARAELEDFESDAARALIDFDILTAQYNVERL